MNSSIPKPLLGIVLVHPPKFDALLHLISSLSSCTAGQQRALELAVVFSSAEDERALASRSDVASSTSLVVHPVVLDRPWPGHNTPYPSVVAFKRFYSIAQLFDRSDESARGWRSSSPSTWPSASFRDVYDYALLFDSELEVFSCDEVGKLPQRVHKADARGVAYAHASCVEKMVNRTRACALMAARDAEEFGRLEALTQRFRLYSYWNDLPYVRLSVLEELLQMWSGRVNSGLRPSVGHGLMRSSRISYRETVMLFNPARWLFGYPFEHMLVQLFLLARGRLDLVDVTPRFDNAEAKRLAASHGSFIALTRWPEQWETIVAPLEPLWVPRYLARHLREAACGGHGGGASKGQCGDASTSPYRSPALTFDTDAVHYNGPPPLPAALRRYYVLCAQLDRASRRPVDR